MKKTLSLLLCVGVLVALCIVPATAEGVSGKLSFFFWDEPQRGIMQDVIDIFNESYPDVEVELTAIPFADYWLKLQTSLGSPNGPDVFWMNPARALTYLPMGVVEPLDAYIEADGVDMSVFPEALRNNFTYDGQLYGIPKDYDTIGLFFNKSIFDEMGVEYPTDDWTWDDLFTAAKALTGNGYYGLCLNLGDKQSVVCNFLYTNGVTGLTEDRTTIHMNEPEVKEAIEFLLKMVDEGVSPDYNGIQELNSNDRFMGGMSAMTFSGSWSTAPYQEALGEENVGVVEVPIHTREGCGINGLGICINSASENKDLAWLFAKTFTTYEAGVAQSKVVIPAYLGAEETWKSAYGSLDVSCFMRAAETSWPLINATIATADQNDVYSAYIQKIWSGEIGVDEGLALIDEECAAIVAAAE